MTESAPLLGSPVADADVDCAEAPRAWGTGRGPGWVIETAIVVGLALLVGVTVAGYAADDGARLLTLDVVVGVGACALIPALLRWPLPAAVAVTLLAALSPAATPVATAAALYVAESRRFRVAAAVAGAGVVAHAVQGAWRPYAGLPYGWWLLLLAAAYAALIGWGTLARVRRALIISLRERARRAEADQERRITAARLAERTAIAREMHDVLAHRLTLLATYAGALEYRPDAAPEKLSEAAGVIRAGVRQALDELRTVITVLRDDDPDGEAASHPQPSLRDLDRLVAEARETGTAVAVHNRLETEDELPAATGRTAYRIIQEGLTNARRHATGAAVEVVIEGRPGGRLRIEVRNPVLVSTPGPASSGAGMGLLGLAERVQLAGGEIDHGRTDTGEFQLQTWLPWPS